MVFSTKMGYLDIRSVFNVALMSPSIDMSKNITYSSFLPWRYQTKLSSERSKIHTSNAILSSGIPWIIPRVSCIFNEWDVPVVYHKGALLNYTIYLYHAIENTVVNATEQCDIRAVHDGKVGCSTVENTTASLYSDWLYFLWHGIKGEIALTSFSLICKNKSTISTSCLSLIQRGTS